MGPKECVCSMRCLAKLEDSLAVLNAFLCSWNRVAKLRPVCPTYALPQSGHVNLYTPDRECISEVCCICINNFCVVLLVKNAIFMLVFLNRLVMDLVSLPTEPSGRLSHGVACSGGIPRIGTISALSLLSHQFPANRVLQTRVSQPKHNTQ